MKTNIYFIGIYKDNKTAVIQAVRDVDYLNCEIAKFYGPRITTKKQLKENKKIVLRELKKERYFAECNKIRVE